MERQDMNAKAQGIIIYLTVMTVVTAFAVSGLWWLIPAGLFTAYMVYALA